MLGAQRSSDGLAWAVRTQLPPSPGKENSGRFCHCPDKCQCGDNRTMAYVDDFIGAYKKADSEFLWNSFLHLLSELGLKPSEIKGHLCPPAEKIIGLGVLIDLQENTLAVPTDKLESTIYLLQDWVARTEASKRQLQKLLGVLLH